MPTALPVLHYKSHSTLRQKPHSPRRFKPVLLIPPLNTSPFPADTPGSLPAAAPFYSLPAPTVLATPSLPCPPGHVSNPSHQNADLGLALDISRIPFPEDYLASKDPAMQQAFADMAALEKGAIANPDEKRMVGH